ncbi:hypothetical protein JI739_03530 [Ramlibacter sp. AW1]|uniref:Uncharacterized protein n=1 Tax=Ramlibacter aurantiacus TaxID=2801330 RepID=A0A936ZEE4_9BURK|nr:hypothetical protein [Ramlibacter aurantiacus]MBL0419412.1 hypothetical protein [Ramlibacter aurantiacus]
MNDLSARLVRILGRVVLLSAALIMAAALALAGLVLLAGWGVYAAFARLTGRPVVPFVLRVDPRAGFGRFWRSAAPADESSRTPRADASRGRTAARRIEVTDVEPVER